MRTPREVLEDHLRLSQDQHSRLEDDLKRNFAPDVVILTSWGVYRGHGGMRELAQKLRRELPDAQFTYDRVLVEGGADSYVIRGERIVAQTIAYTVVLQG